MIQLHYSNRTEALLEALAHQLTSQRGRRSSLLEPVHLVVPNPTMERYVELGIARELGVAANLVFHRLERFIADWLAAMFPGLRLLDSRRIESALIGALLDEDLLARGELRPVADYLQGAGDSTDGMDRRRVQLASRIARRFEEYAFSRPELLRAWSRGARELGGTEYERTEVWQQVLWSYARQAVGLSTTPAWASADWADGAPLEDRWVDLDDVLTGLRSLPAGGPSATQDPQTGNALPPGARAGSSALSPWPALHVFGVSYVARAFQRIFDLLATHTELHLYTLNPCMEFWEDLPAESELRQQLKQAAVLPHRAERLGRAQVEVDEDPFGLAGDETPGLRLWGRPGREHVRLLNELTECDFDPCFRDPLAEGDCLLGRLQRDILTREPERSQPQPLPGGEATPSVQLYGCTGVRREVETIADEIWSLVRQDDQTTRPAGELPLRFNDIALIVNAADRDAYLPHIQAVFEEAHGIPCNIVDLPLTTASAVIEAAVQLLELPLGRFARPEVLAVVSHPAVSQRFGEVDPSAFANLCDRLGAFQGIDHQDHDGTYVDQDVFNFEQAVVRLAIGAFVTGEASGDARRFEHNGQRYLVEEPGADSVAAARFGLLVRSLAADVRFARAGPRPPGEWAEFLSRLFAGYLTGRSDPEQTALRRCLAAAHELGHRGLPPRPLSYRIAAELVRRSLDAMTGTLGDHLADGVVVSSFQPMRAIPFRVVFVAGLGEGRFPASTQRDTMDLRGASRRAGDVSPAERDRYLFLETLLCARERLYLSYVARDEQTGDVIAPSPVVQELSHIIEQSYQIDAAALTRRPPLRRHELAGQGEPGTVLGEAWREAQARALGNDLREHLRTRACSLEAASDLSELRRGLGDRWPPLGHALSLSPPPRPEAGAQPGSAATHSAPEILRLSLGALRGFLQCPLQGWARTVLGLGEDDDGGIEDIEDEPFAPSTLDRTAALREVFLREQRGEGSREELYADAVDRLVARGRWSTGALRRLREQPDAQVLDAWQQQLDSLDPAPAGVPAQDQLVRVRIGPGLEHLEVDQQVDPICLDLEVPDGLRLPGLGSGALRVELSGTTQPLLPSQRSSLVLLARTLGEQERGRVRRLREALRGFLDHLALCAAGVWAPGPHHTQLLYDAPAMSWSLTLQPVEPDQARAWLAQLTADLLAGPHDYLMPCEAVLRLADRFDEVEGDELVESIALVRDRWGGGQSAWGPVPRPLERPLPQPADALEWARRRFGLFFERCGLGRAEVEQAGRNKGRG